VRQIMLPVSHIITHLTQGPAKRARCEQAGGEEGEQARDDPASASCVCHFDTDKKGSKSRLTWQLPPGHAMDNQASLQPEPAQCSGLGGTRCVSPCCMFYGRQGGTLISADPGNAATGRHHYHRTSRMQRRSTRVSCPRKDCPTCRRNRERLE